MLNIGLVIEYNGFPSVKVRSKNDSIIVTAAQFMFKDWNVASAWIVEIRAFNHHVISIHRN
jgi:hypothetical protein